MNKAEVQEAFKTAGLERLEKDIDVLAKSSIRLLTMLAIDGAFSVGVSKLGGLPDLPADLQWPERKNVPQSFIAQITLEDVRAYDVNKVLPQSGMLWFFYDAQQETFGEDPTDRGGWQVFYREATQQLQRATTPEKLPPKSLFQACALSFTNEITLSQFPKLEIAHFDWTEDEQHKYETLLSTFPSADDHAQVHHRLLGNPNTIQDDMRSQCQLVSHGITDDSTPQATRLLQGAMDWQLLFQVDSDEDAGMNWGNNGMLYYWITSQDLKVQHFDTTWLVLQSE